MSKSKGNAVSPYELIDEYGVDAYRFYFMREFSFGYDGNFSRETMTGRYNSELANDLGNLVSRVLAMVHKYREGTVPQPGPQEGTDAALEQAAAAAFEGIDHQLERLGFGDALNAVWSFLRVANRYVDETAPWDLNKDPDKAGRLDTVLYNLLESLRLTALMILPFMPESAQRVWEWLGGEGPLEDRLLPASAAWGQLRPGVLTQRGTALFPRIEIVEK
jgi:methionyl-tRNA synthetase